MRNVSYRHTLCATINKVFAMRINKKNIIMKKLIWITTIIISFFFIRIECSAQKLQPNELKADLDTLVSMIETVHPEPYHYISKNAFYRKVNKMKEGINQPMTDYQFYLKV